MRSTAGASQGATGERLSLGSRRRAFRHPVLAACRLRHRPQTNEGAVACGKQQTVRSCSSSAGPEAVGKVRPTCFTHPAAVTPAITRYQGHDEGTVCRWSEKRVGGPRGRSRRAEIQFSGHPLPRRGAYSTHHISTTNPSDPLRPWVWVPGQDTT